MSIDLLFGCCQIETCAHDLDAARTFLTDVLGGAPVEQELARQIAALIPGDAYDVDHVGCGRAVFQINRPSPAMAYRGNPSVHQQYLDTSGPCVTNLNYFVDDIAHAHALLTSLGAPTLIEGPSSAARALADYGEANTRPGADERPFLFMGTRNLIGFDLEIMEPNFLHFADQTTQFPAFVEPRPGASGGDLELHRLLIAVPDLQALLDSLRTIFTPASRSKPYALIDGPSGRSFRLALGGMEIEFCEPRGAAGDLARTLAERGPGVFTIAFGTADPAPLLERAAAAGIPAARQHTDHLGNPTALHSTLLASQTAAGFDTLVEPPEVFWCA
ncbi:hypothetical protein [Novosphingobium album (ex Hu et al. 2023)]|uniref:VOC family protein n=1 Tax=Novosphingobium album (ex Hu et al. 2023) TaxID=2930093 RepID=A0ABT0B710_9SPHN|nr:hypothetical protein [Novosphingobium album (ex Hu et al. 2023)]MCJ2180860.1 hypothetical protein [Novosphingobium album (ex Hu et al. 2023)]